MTTTGPDDPAMRPGGALATAAGIGVCGAVVQYVVAHHYLQIEWVIDPPIPVVWWAVGGIAGMLGASLFLVLLGRRSARLVAMPWRRLLLTWVAPCLAVHLVWLAVTLVLLRRYNPGLTGVPARDLRELVTIVLLPPPELSLLYVLALFPVLAKAARRVPAAALVTLLAAATPLTTTATYAVFLAVGLRFTQIDRLVAGASRRNLVLRGAVAVAGASVLGVDRIPQGTAVVVAGLAALPFGLTVAAMARGRLLAAMGAAAVPAYLLLVPVLCVVDAVLLSRLSARGSAVQLAVAVAWPVVLTAGIVAGGLVLGALGRRRLTSLVSVVLLLAATGCAPGEPPTGPEVTLVFAGDVHFEGRVDKLLDNPATAFGPVAKDLADGDLTFVNLETPITGRGTPEPKRYLFRARDGAVPALKAAGVDAVSLANNHSLDYGRQGLADTLAAARRGGLGTVGAGRDAEAYQPWRRTVRGVRIAVLAFNQVDDLAEQWAARPDRAGLAMAFDENRALTAVRDARAANDLVVVLPHWGTEGDRCPDRRQVDFAAALVGAGADIIVGAHAHVLQGAGRTGNAYVAYGLGNFLWYSSGLFAPHSARSGVLKLTVRKRTVVRSEFLPTVVSDTGQPTAVTGWRAGIARDNFTALRSCAKLGPVDGGQ